MNLLKLTCCLLLWSTLHLLAQQQVGALPNSLRAYSRVVYKKPEWKEPELNTVEEFVNQKDENVMLKVRSDKNPTYKNYYRINGEPPAKDTSGPSALIEYDPEEHECKLVKTDQWPLESISRFLKTLRGNSGVKFGKDKAKDRTALGPIALLRLVLANGELFKVGSHSERREAHFTTAFNLPDKHLLRVILTLPEAFLEKCKIDRKKKDRSIAFLSDMKLDELYALKLSFVIARQDEFTAGCGPEILFENLDHLESLHISFMAIQERSVSKHQGLSSFDQDEENPFTLPSGTGCGSQGRLFFLEAKQFSGLFSGERLTDQQFVAYDGRSKHLRIDRLGESKMIYNFGNQKSLLYVADHQLDNEQGGGLVSQPRDKCASVLLQKQDNELDLVETRSLADIIGFDLGTGLNYLGSRTLEDGVHCLVFERELSSMKKIPLLAKLNMRIQPKQGDRMFLTLYFVDEFKESKQNAERNQDRGPQMDSILLDSMWLKRIELQTKKTISCYNQLISQITFSQSGWNLNIWTDYEDDRRSRSLHPARTFDTIECRPPAASDDQTFKIELIIEQIISPKSQVKQLQEANSVQRQYAFFEQPEKLEEAVMTFLTATTRIPRSHINQLELILPEHRLSQASTKSSSYRIFAGVEIADPLEFQFTKNLVGWVKTYKEIALALKENVVLLRVDESNNNRYECMMNVATSLMQDVKSATMLFCPHVGCGYVKDLGNFEFIKAESSGSSSSNQTLTTSNYWDMCEIHSLNKIHLPIETGNRLNFENIKSQLMNAKFSMKSILGESQPESVSDDDFVGKIVKVSVLKHEHQSSQSLGRHLQSGLCFGEGQQQAKPVDSGDHRELQVVQFALDQHQSSAIYCHKACLLYPHCQTYSYSQTKRVCTLTSLPASEALGYTLRHADRFTKDSSCHLYGLNSLRLYSSLQMSLITSLAGLDSTHQYYFTRASKETCASLCHDNELDISDSASTSCRGFKYFSVNSMCAIEDKNSHLYKKLLGDTMVASLGSSYSDKSKYFRSFLANPNEWTDTNQCQFYERDYAQYYEHKARTKLDIPKESSSTAGDAEDVAISELKTLFDMDLQDCLRECTLIEENCLMLDHCFHPINGTPTRYCTMYQIKRDNSQGGQSLSLNQLLNSIEKTSSKKQRPEFKLNPACNNYRLSEDYSMLKGKLSQPSQAKDPLLDNISELDANKSATYIEGMKSFIDDKLLTERRTGDDKQFTFWSASLMLVIGSVSGLLLAAYLVEPKRIRPTIEVISNNGSNTNSCSSGTSPSNISGFRMTQSPSSADLQSRPELFELYEN